MADWLFKNEPIVTLPDDCEAFVYLITNTTDGRMYVGKKLAKFKTTKPPLKGKKNKRRGTKESDWRTYWGSNDHLKEDVLNLGEDKFTREILYFCASRGIASYLEAREQFDRKVLLTDDYYNGIINVRVGGSKILKEGIKDI
ncbi:hypothetical protein N9N08_00850 [bacterium]|jgi:hypothetical protein|nr:hypothetical protein [bacterium]|tara:strand:+ start:140 stop:565 length:426 start_codon:yes stop_codon:yes gene_type:complete